MTYQLPKSFVNVYAISVIAYEFIAAQEGVDRAQKIDNCKTVTRDIFNYIRSRGPGQLLVSGADQFDNADVVFTDVLVTIRNYWFDIVDNKDPFEGPTGEARRASVEAAKRGELFGQKQQV